MRKSPVEPRVANEHAADEVQILREQLLALRHAAGEQAPCLPVELVPLGAVRPGGGVSRLLDLLQFLGPLLEPALQLVADRHGSALEHREDLARPAGGRVGGGSRRVRDDGVDRVEGGQHFRGRGAICWSASRAALAWTWTFSRTSSTGFDRRRPRSSSASFTRQRLLRNSTTLARSTELGPLSHLGGPRSPRDPLRPQSRCKLNLLSAYLVRVLRSLPVGETQFGCGGQTSHLCSDRAGTVPPDLARGVQDGAPTVVALRRHCRVGRRLGGCP